MLQQDTVKMCFEKKEWPSSYRFVAVIWAITMQSHLQDL